MKYSFALIGAGGIGAIWADGALKLTSEAGDEIVIKTVVDTDKARAELVAGKLGAAVATDYEEVLRDEEINGVIVALPHYLLAPVSHAALRAGKHVICEKPAGITTKEVQENCDLAREKGLVYMVAYNHRYHPAYAEAKKLFDEGTIGKLLFIRARYGFGGRPGYQNEWRFNKAVGGGGELIDQGAHMIDMVRWFMGNITETQGIADNLYWGGEVEDNAFLLLRSEKKVASIHVSWTNWEWVHSFEIFGDKGYLWIDGLDSRYRGPERLTVGTHDPQVSKFPVERVQAFDTEGKADSFARELAAFRDAMNGQQNKIPTGDDAVAVLTIVEKIYNAQA